MGGEKLKNPLLEGPIADGEHVIPALDVERLGLWHETGQAVEALKDWRLTFGTDRMAVFSRGNTDAVVRLPEP